MYRIDILHAVDYIVLYIVRFMAKGLIAILLSWLLLQSTWIVSWGGFFQATLPTTLRREHNQHCVAAAHPLATKCRVIQHSSTRARSKGERACSRPGVSLSSCHNMYEEYWGKSRVFQILLCSKITANIASMLTIWHRLLIAANGSTAVVMI